jgi:hypothetical protein
MLHMVATQHAPAHNEGVHADVKNKPPSPVQHERRVTEHPVLLQHVPVGSVSRQSLHGLHVVKSPR